MITRPTLRALALVAAGAVPFVLLATMNAAGYRYGAADQAFYLPSVLQEIDPALYPADRSVLAAQDALMLTDEIVGRVARSTGVSVPALFFAGYVIGLALLYGAGIAFARALGQSWLGAALIAAILTLRHRIPKTGVNSLEGYFHPRIMAFAVGMAAAALFLRGRTIWALAAVVGAAAIHPTIALWFACWLLAASIVSDLRLRRWLLAATAVGAVAAIWALTAGPMRARLVRIDDAWMSVIAAKDYLFPLDWPLDAWLLNLAMPIVLVVVYRRRRQRGAASPRDRGLVAGALFLTALFLVSVPLAASRMALVVQLQVSRVFWLIEFAAIAYLIAEVDAYVGRAVVALPKRFLIVGIVALLSLARGWYVMRVEHPGRAVWQVRLPRDEWHDAMAWLARTRVDAAVLTDPGHAYRHGTSVRVGAQRDVYLEEVKDAALAIYSRDVAMRVRRRILDLKDYAKLTAAHAVALARRHRLRYLVTERRLNLPEVYRNRRFHVYDLTMGTVPISQNRSPVSHSEKWGQAPFPR